VGLGCGGGGCSDPILRWNSAPPLATLVTLLQADIPLAHRRFFYATGDVDFLAASWPTLNATCRFWECRFMRSDSVGPNGPPGYGPHCSPKDGSGNWTVPNVIPPDESAGAC
jgi:chitodextrinase